MIGSLSKTEILAHAGLFIRNFGYKVFSALRAGRAARIAVVDSQDAGRVPCADRTVEQFVNRCVNLTMRAARSIEKLGRLYAGDTASRRFFLTLANDEWKHADMLELTLLLTGSTERMQAVAKNCRNDLPAIGEVLHGVEAALTDDLTLEEALSQVVRIEATELNRVFSSVLTAADSELIALLPAFRGAIRRHVDYICREMPALDANRATRRRPVDGGLTRPSCRRTPVI